MRHAERPERHQPAVETAPIADLIRRHRVCWEVWPEQRAEGTELRNIGFNLELYGLHDHPRTDPHAGCSECVAVYADLRRIAAAIMPTGAHDASYELRLFEGALHYDERGAEVRLTIAIRHRSSVAAPVDACEVHCLDAMQDALRRLGAHKRGVGYS